MPLPASVSPAKERVTVYHYETDAAPTFYLFTDMISVNIFDGLQLCIADLLK